MASEYFVVMSPGSIRWRRQWDRSTPVAETESRGGGGCSVGRTGVGGREGRPTKSEFSRKSANRLRDVMTALPWDECGTRLAMVTLTYPGGDNWRELVPDWDTLVRHREAFKEAWRRKWGPPKGTWHIEFQVKRRAPHIHLYVGLPEDAVIFKREGLGVDKRGRPVERWSWDWALKTWDRIRTDGAGASVTQGVDVRECWFPGVDGAKYIRRVVQYFWMESGTGASSKGLQKVAPENFGGSGRWYGVWGMKPRFTEVEVDKDTWYRTRRVGRGLRARRAKRLRARVRRRNPWRGTGSTRDGIGVFGVDGIEAGVKLLRWDERQRTADAMAGGEG